MPHGKHTALTVVGGGLAGLTAAITAAEAGARVTLYEAHHTLGGRARTTDAPYRTHEGPHALYDGGPHWTWLKRRDLLGPVAAVPPLDAARLRFHRDGALRRTPPPALLRLLPRRPELAPVDEDFTTWAARIVGPEGARAAANFTAVALFHHDPGELSARFVQERLRRTTKLPPEAHYPLDGWSAIIDRMAARAWNLGVRVETCARLDTVPTGTPTIVATSLDAARRLLKDDSLTWQSGRTTLVDLALRRRRGDLFAVSGIDFPGWIERFTAADTSLAPPGESLVQGQIPLAPHESKADGSARADRLLDLAFPGWRERTAWRRDAVAQGRTGALDRPGTTWRDRPAIDRGHGVTLAGDMVAAPGVLSEVSFTSAIEAATLALRSAAATTTRGLDLNRT
ncbi:NAD(P)-binding protein [Streptomyces sp. VRA16 Mangrove soil]|uniref:NAD(P)-binding protein n=1 Tax=Streptomyces sp. VRA16 Mangrove soil TaxID=2817434 RepID=UPI001A9D6A58|nr:NAD(P)-binding protein [Streptomyces sp. VRA16 Mangrove soil]MBO1337926.1 NAD(P)-binding protein [Streptomyces sp. VRA16 Mangrove soil]